MSFKKQCQADRNAVQRWITDPLTALLVGVFWVFFKILPIRARRLSVELWAVFWDGL